MYEYQQKQKSAISKKIKQISNDNIIIVQQQQQKNYKEEPRKKEVYQSGIITQHKLNLQSIDSAIKEIQYKYNQRLSSFQDPSNFRSFFNLNENSMKNKEGEYNYPIKDRFDRQSLLQLRKKIQEQSEQNLKMQLTSYEKRQKKLKEEVLQDSQRFMQTLFEYYYQVYINIEVLLYQQLTPFNDVQLFKKKTVSVDSLGPPKLVTLKEIMFPPVVCVDDFRIYLNQSTNKTYFKLYKKFDLYQTSKPKQLIRLDVGIVDLVKVIRWIMLQLKNCIVEKKQFYFKLEEFRNLIRNFDIPYQTIEVLQLLAVFVKQEIQKQPFFVQYMKALKKNSQILQSDFIQLQYKHRYYQNEEYKQHYIQSFCSNIQTKVEQFVIKCSLEFIGKVCFYNFILGLSTFYIRQHFSFIRFLQLKQQQLNKMSFTHLKLKFFQTTLKRPDILKRMFKESLDVKLTIKLRKKQIQQSEFTMPNFLNIVYSIPQEQEVILNLRRYQIHFCRYVLQLISECSCKQNLFLSFSYNSYRLLLMFLLSYFFKKTIKVIDREIKQCYGQSIYSKILIQRNNCNSWIHCNQRIEKSREAAKHKIQQYLKDNLKTNSQNSAIIQSLAKEDKQLFSLFRRLNKEKQSKLTSTLQSQISQIQLIYQKILKIASTEFFNQNRFSKVCKKLSKQIFNFNFFHFHDFVSNRPINISKLKPTQIAIIEKNLPQFQKQFKIVQIQMLKFYNILTTLPFYSYNVEKQSVRLKNTQGKRLITQSYSQLLKNLDTFQIVNSERMNTTYLKRHDRTMGQINEILQYQTQSTFKLNTFFLQCVKLNKLKQDNTLVQKLLMTSAHNQNKCADIPTKLSISMRNNNRSIQQIQNQQQKIMKQLTTKMSSDLTDSSVYVNTLNSGENFNFNLNQLVGRQIHKEKLSIFNIRQSLMFIRQAVQNLLTQKQIIFKPAMDNVSLKRNLNIVYNFDKRMKKQLQSSEKPYLIQRKRFQSPEKPYLIQSLEISKMKQIQSQKYELSQSGLKQEQFYFELEEKEKEFQQKFRQNQKKFQQYETQQY